MKNFQASGEASNHAVLTVSPVLQNIFVCSSFVSHFDFLQCCGSGMFIPDPNFSIPDPNCFHPRSRIRIKKFKYFNPKILFPRSRKYDPGCSSRIRILIFHTSRIPNAGVKKAPDPGSVTLSSWILNLQHCTLQFRTHLKSLM
jgi:hypothetical protein